jgi:peptidoglycan DL-endopeptidase LytE
MKGRLFTAIILAITALLFIPCLGEAKAAAKKRARHTSQQSAKSASVRQSYSVQAGDSLYRIAKEFRTTPDALKSLNRLKDNTIKVGQVIKVPVSKTAAAKSAPSNTAEATRTPNETYISAAPGGSADSDQANNSEASSTRLKLKQAGFDLIGERYRFGASGNGAFDCSGLVKSLFSKFNIDLPRSSKEQFKQGQKVSKDELQIGDLVFFSSGGTQPTHVGIYVGDNKFLHAARKARQVVVSDLSKIWYTMRYLGARRVMDLWSDEPVTE